MSETAEDLRGSNSGVNLVGAYEKCMTAFSCLEQTGEYGEQYQLQAFQMLLLQLRLSRWQESMDSHEKLYGLREESGVVLSSKTQTQTKEALNRLDWIHEDLEIARERSKRYQRPDFSPVEQSARGAAVNALSTTLRELIRARRKPCPSHGTPWAMHNPRKLFNLVEDVAKSIAELTELFPTSIKRQDELAEEELSALISDESLQGSTSAIAVLGEVSYELDPQIHAAFERIAMLQEGLVRDYLCRHQMERFISNVQPPQLEDPVMIGGHDILPALRVCDTIFERLTFEKLDPHGEHWNLATYLVFLRNKLLRFRQSVRWASSPHAEFPQVVGDSVTLEKTKEDLELLGDALRKLESRDLFPRPKISDAGNTRSSKMEDGVSPMTRLMAKQPSLIEEKGQSVYNVRGGKPEDGSIKDLVNRINFSIASIYERFPQTLGPQKILAAADARKLLKFTGGNNEHGIRNVAFQVDIYLEKALKALGPRHFIQRY